MAYIRNVERDKLRSDLMSFSACVRKLKDIFPYVNRYALDRMGDGKHVNQAFIELLDTEDPGSIYGFLNFLRQHVYVFGGILKEKRKFSEDTMYNFLTQVATMPPTKFTQSVRTGKVVDKKAEWKKMEVPGYRDLTKKWEEFQAAKAKAAKAKKAKAAK